MAVASVEVAAGLASARAAIHHLGDRMTGAYAPAALPALL
jgi:hypothetical protein